MQLTEHLAPLTLALDELREKRGLDFAMLLVTDVVRGTSRLLLSSLAPPILDDLPYPPCPMAHVMPLAWFRERNNCYQRFWVCWKDNIFLGHENLVPYLSNYE
jgi:hypothetical protein